MFVGVQTLKELFVTIGASALFTARSGIFCFFLDPILVMKK